jgi:Tol biopolymer transport system component
MGANGQDSRPIMNLERRYEFRGPKWSPDGQRLVYVRNTFGTTEGSIEARALSDGATTTLVAGMGLLDFWWTADGRLIYSQAAPSEEATYDLLELRIDSKSLSPIGEPHRLTRWVGHSPGFVSISTDGKRIVTTKGYTQSDVYVAELDGNQKLKPEHGLTIDTRSDWPSSWTKNGNEVLYFSDRSGSFNIFKQSPSSERAEVVLGGIQDAREPQLSPDGQWLLYTLWPDKQKSPVRIMRLAQSGGTSEKVLEAAGPFASGITFSPGGEQDLESKGARMLPDFHCPLSGTNSCIVAEASQDSVVFTRFDPAAGRGMEVARVKTSPSKFFWDLSPNGSQIAYGEFRSKSGDHITILGLNDQASREVSLGTWTNMSSVAWSASGTDLFLTTLRREGSDLLHMTLDGKVNVLSEQKGRWFGMPRPAPNGRFLAFGLRTVDSNVWLIENR